MNVGNVHCTWTWVWMKGYVHEHVYGQKCNNDGCVHCTLTMTMLYYYITYCTMQSKHGVHTNIGKYYLYYKHGIMLHLIIINSYTIKILCNWSLLIHKVNLYAYMYIDKS